ncbi:hypothetical protein [Bradyrhizobium sp. P5_C11_2]
MDLRGPQRARELDPNCGDGLLGSELHGEEVAGSHNPVPSAHDGQYRAYDLRIGALPYEQAFALAGEDRRKGTGGPAAYLEAGEFFSVLAG